MTDEREDGRTNPEPGRELVVPKKAPLVVNEKGYIAPTTVEEAARMAQAVLAGNLAPSSYNNDAGKIMLGIMSALEAGLPPLFGLRNIAIINGRPTIFGDAAMALVQSKNLIEDYREEEIGPKPEDSNLATWDDGYGWRVSIKRRGQTGEYVGEFTVGQARLAKLWLNHQKKPWNEFPSRMLKIRARTFALRDGFADALAGLAIREEVEDTFGADSPTVTDTSFLNDEPEVEDTDREPIPAGEEDEGGRRGHQA